MTFITKDGKVFKFPSRAGRHSLCALFAAAVAALLASPAAMADPLPSLQAGFTGAGGLNLASLTTLSRAQGFAFQQSLSRRQNSLHETFSPGSSEAFFGESKESHDAVNGAMDVLAKQLGLDEEGGGRPEFWSQGFTRFGKVGSDSASTYRYQLDGFAGGIDMKRGENWTVGFAGGYSRARSEFVSTTTTGAAVETYHSAVYATYDRKNFTLDSTLGFGYLRASSERDTGNGNHRTAEGVATGRTINWSVTAATPLQAGGFVLTPMAGFTFSSQKIGGVEEHGSSQNLASGGSASRSLRPLIGLDVAHDIALGGGAVVTPEIYGIYRYEMLDSAAEAAMRQAESNGTTFTSAQTRLSRHALQIGGGIGMKLGEGLSGKLMLDSDLQPGSHEHRGLFRLTASW